jgi:hypothetical protein
VDKHERKRTRDFAKMKRKKKTVAWVLMIGDDLRLFFILDVKRALWLNPNLIKRVK